ncbi:hybrid sensor histidine kinase/response regulator [Nostoc sp. MBR 210]|uniref:histidine kinase n=1 Tax=Nostoc spongiaeforme FACHB-130 TaxID=1357510 RepID=A0ABR8FNW6_9NOSO|nr:response regulator [Nostoc spongiaeforme]MBD2593131.1 response regulator [Nostoc spongiaeforme FACHB-130]OCQ99897.1 hybrid sensor histidine kinase/response regulator [Nostoc sp. MBR 210]
MNKILVIEDDINVRQNLVDLLYAENFNVITAENGYFGLQLAQTEVPDLVICDVMMPEIDGYEVLKELRQNPRTAIIPFIFLTAKSEKPDFRKGMDLGADDYIVKPFSRTELLAAITCRLEKQTAIYQQTQDKLDKLRTSITLSLPHELRTPLNGILGFSQILMEESELLDAASIKEMAEFIHQSSQRLFHLIQKFLLYAELEIIATDPQRVCEIQKQSTEFPTPGLTNLIDERVKNAGRENDIQIDLSPCIVKISLTKITRIIEELLDNALKFSVSGTPIKITAKTVNHTFSVSFSDRGRGMSREQIAELGAYRQFERKLHEQQGSGLGLIIAKKLAELHGGTLKIDSKPQEYTIVTVTLPCNNEEAEASLMTQHSALST